MYTPNMTAPRVLSVTQLNTYIKSIIDNDPGLNIVFLSGEISNLNKNQRSGHIYLTLKDEMSVIKAVMFAGNAKKLRFMPTNGMKIICRGRVSLYGPSGQYQLYIEDMQPDGIGDLAVAYEQLKNSLEKKGYFDSAHKKPIPEFPRYIGVVTSPSGAAVQDIKNIISRRYPCAKIVMCPVLVQGEDAPAQLVNAVRLLDKNKACDVIIIGRGGGSAEDLWAFNSEELAQAIYDCKIPVISAVGHETDYTICDFVSDLRAPTPSAAAELAVPDIEEITAFFYSQMMELRSITDAKFRVYKASLNNIAEQMLQMIPYENIRGQKLIIKNKLMQMKQTASDSLGELIKNISVLSTQLEELNPIEILARGYSVAEKDGKRITSKNELKKSDKFTLEFSDGKIDAQVI